MMQEVLFSVCVLPTGSLIHRFTCMFILLIYYSLYESFLVPTFPVIIIIYIFFPFPPPDLYNMSLPSYSQLQYSFFFLNIFIELVRSVSYDLLASLTNSCSRSLIYFVLSHFSSNPNLCMV